LQLSAEFNLVIVDGGPIKVKEATGVDAVGVKTPVKVVADADAPKKIEHPSVPRLVVPFEPSPDLADADGIGVPAVEKGEPPHPIRVIIIQGDVPSHRDAIHVRGKHDARVWNPPHKVVHPGKRAAPYAVVGRLLDPFHKKEPLKPGSPLMDSVDHTPREPAPLGPSYIPMGLVLDIDPYQVRVRPVLIEHNLPGV